jgi:tRNA-dihydrouridine synthase A
MLGRAAYHTPAILADVDSRFYGEPAAATDLREVVEEMLRYVAAEQVAGTRPASITRHMLGLFHGHAGARRWRQILGTQSGRPDAGPDVIREALAAVASHPVSLDFPRQRSQTGALAAAVA